MYKKTKPRSVMELLNKNLSEREVASTLSCSRNTVSGVIERMEKHGKVWDDIKDLSDDEVYEMLFPVKCNIFLYKKWKIFLYNQPRYASVS